MESIPPPSKPPPGAPPLSTLYADEGKVARSWRLTGAAWQLMRRSPTMLILAFFSLASAVVSTILVFYLAGFFSPGPHSNESLALYGAICAYPTVFLSVFLNVALAYAASAAFDGEQVDLSEALDAAASRVRSIAMWSLISVLVGFALNQIARRVPWGGALVRLIFGAVWNIGTLFVIPLLALERAPAVPAVRRSFGIAKSRWKEEVSGNIAIGAWTVVVAVPAIFLLTIGASVAHTNPAGGVPMMYLGVGLLAATIALSASTAQVFAVALYRHAIDAPTGDFSRWDLENPFTGKPAKQRKSWILRIGVPFLAVMAVLMVIAAIMGPHRHRTAADPYWHVRSLTSQAYGVSTGTPITYHGRQVGTVVASTIDGPETDVAFSVKPTFPPGLLQHGFQVVRRGGHVSLRVVGR